MNLLVLNSGSSSLKFQVIFMPRETVLISGRVENIGDDRVPSVLRCCRPGKPAYENRFGCPDHAGAVRRVFQIISHPDQGCLKGVSDLSAVGHRVVHGGKRFSGPVIITDPVMEAFRGLSELAPLHMPINISCIEAARDCVPAVFHTACFDTAFFHDLPEYAFLYPVPMKWHEAYDVRRYGFHGISYEYVTAAAAKMLKTTESRLKLIVTHLGNGSSIMAMDHGKVLDTSMGFTPLEGLMMGTRSGNFDPAVFPHVMRKTGMSVDEIIEVLNTRSGLLGISGISRDMRRIIKTKDSGCGRAALAFDMFIHILRKYIGAYFFALGGADAIVFTGGIGENSPEIRQAVFENLSGLGLRLDPEKNQCMVSGRKGAVHDSASSVKILVIPTNEELMIARSVFRLTTGARSGFSSRKTAAS